MFMLILLFKAIYFGLFISYYVKQRQKWLLFMRLDKLRKKYRFPSLTNL